ncbi:peptide/nickel transport system substrate-binding protein [Actinopolyspora mzabensis]|uniref:Peptide/nickel transport system substrate-binding protein n=1 Tax=Actinopolyspora mzabensis TaxID=995066 RepID=A0A1G9ASB3_ACTMZ|nr:ABC transporter substrate-binding protein [Actinopolyspora mzabensis]SDK30199.1 peptide/nickel transport system substrate-binding protein [Actinopolyspora mzabensis]
MGAAAGPGFRLSRVGRRLVTVGLTAVLATSLSACVQSQRGEDNGQTMVFGAPGAPALFDPFYASDGETFRVTRQMMEGLVGFESGGVEVEPELATDWNSSDDGTKWTFQLREGVKFHDGTDFNAEAVCANFERWYNQTGTGQSSALSYYWIETFGGFAGDDEPSLFSSCEAPDPTTAVINLTRATSKFPAALGLDSFSMQSPTAMKKYEADKVEAKGSGFEYSEYARKHPTGTGPFEFDSYDQNNQSVELRRNDDYWGDKAKLDRLIFKVISDESVRKQELLSGGIDGYDFPNPADLDSLRQQDFNVQVREPFNVLYLGMSQKKNPALRKLKVRKALAYAVNRENLVNANLPDGAKVANLFYPSSVDGYADDVAKYSYDPEKAKRLLNEAGHSDLTIEFWWPTQVTRPYMPDPRGIFNSLAGDMRKAGINVKPVSKPWNGGYISDVNKGDAEVFLLGWTGDYNSPDNFIGTFFGSTENQFYTKPAPWGEKLANRLDAADKEPDPTKRERMYTEINRDLKSKYLPAVPLSHSPPAIVTAPHVKGLVTSPLTAEEFASVSIEK